MKNAPLIIERILNASVEKVWKAITDKDHMKQWYFDLEEFRPEVGFEFSFTAGKDEKKYLHICKITEVVENRKIAYTWRYDGYPGNSLVIFELFPEGNRTKLRLTHEGLETFPESNPDLSRKNFNEGWIYFIGTALPDFINKQAQV
ncbi:SRPBCC domain-containing protein [Sinomicrobium pectinilyticum]|uniref:SRPBCC domain-containing protein n=1 Tax=Sinomicrobium pectinilyticum TaxID=1084421 RepID=A0A3N0EU55_SINP1|nr:SRPBCC domain-containing protein [Sinomicrobium pectinilyticum]RNL91396.1 SRPBCC domain-containing protein [Sinomicrobium pectinilyticum]